VLGLRVGLTTGGGHERGHFDQSLAHGLAHIPPYRHERVNPAVTDQVGSTAEFPEEGGKRQPVGFPEKSAKTPGFELPFLPEMSQESGLSFPAGKSQLSTNSQQEQQGFIGVANGA
jgi:hypothetical protein